MKLTRALLPAAALTLATACLEATYAPPVAPSESDLTAASEPPPPPITGVVLYDGTGDADQPPPDLRSSDRLEIAARRPDECNLPTFCVPARYFQNEPIHNEWLDFESEEPLPEDIRRQLHEVGAACGIDTTEPQKPPTTIFCPVSSTAAGQIFNKPNKQGGTGIAYDVSATGLTVTTVSLEQFDAFFGKGLICRTVEGVAICTTPPVFGDVWVGTDEDQDGVITYTRAAVVLSPFRFVGGSGVVEPPIDVVP